MVHESLFPGTTITTIFMYICLDINILHIRIMKYAGVEFIIFNESAKCNSFLIYKTYKRVRL